MTALCLRPKRQSEGVCTRPAGWGTGHLGEGACKLHGGAARGRPIVHGRYSLKHRESMQEKMEQFLADPEPGRLDSEIALLRTLLQEFLDRYPADSPLPLASINAMYNMVEGIARNVERVSRILNETALTQAEVQFISARIVDVLIKYVPADKLPDALGEAERSLVVPGGTTGAITGGETQAGIA